MITPIVCFVYTYTNIYSSSIMQRYFLNSKFVIKDSCMKKVLLLVYFSVQVILYIGMIKKTTNYLIMTIRWRHYSVTIAAECSIKEREKKAGRPLYLYSQKGLDARTCSRPVGILLF